MFFFVRDRVSKNYIVFVFTDEMARKHIKAEYSNKNGWQLIT